MKVKLFCKQAAQEKFLDVYSQVIASACRRGQVPID